jgi:DNA processing protein
MFALKEQFGSMQEAYLAPEKSLRNILNAKQVAGYKAARYGGEPLEYMKWVEQQGIGYVTFEEKEYPNKLKHIPDPPYGIFVKGRLPDEKKPSVAMIGARACSEYGKTVAREFAEKLAMYDVQIISGMARGIDSVSQRACVQAGGQTYAILGNGVDVCYPEEMFELYDQIFERGGLISTYAPGTPPVSANFPPRNRIISGLSDIVLVVEARKKSGTLITVDMALEQGKEVGIIPGRITDSLSQGCHELIKQGATVIVDVEQLMEILQDSFSLQAAVEKENHSCESTVMERKNITKHMECILEILLEDPTEPLSAEKIYQKWMERGNTGTFREVMEGLLDLELLDLCKSNKNSFLIR